MRVFFKTVAAAAALAGGLVAIFAASPGQAEAPAPGATAAKSLSLEILYNTPSIIGDFSRKLRVVARQQTTGVPLGRLGSQHPRCLGLFSDRWPEAAIDL